jgi:hypothetical protein
MATVKKACKGAIYPKSSSVSKRIGSPSKAKSGGSFPDLNKDGKITKKDVLIGRGVLPKTAKKGMKVKKAQAGKLQPMGDAEIVKKKETPSKSVTKFRSEDGNYTQKYKWEKDKTERPTITQRRTLKGLLSGAPRAAGKLGKLSPMKTGGKMKKCAYGCK